LDHSGGPIVRGIDLQQLLRASAHVSMAATISVITAILASTSAAAADLYVGKGELGGVVSCKHRSGESPSACE
jgi:hypothetical protein